MIIDLAHRFGLSVVGEGIEDEATAAGAARSVSCDVAQGYLFGKPMAHGDFQRWLDERGPGSRRRPRARRASRYNGGFDASGRGPPWISSSPKSSC